MTSYLQRRHFLRIGTAGALGLTLPTWLRGEGHVDKAPVAKHVIQVFLGGGPSTIDMWDLKPGADARVRGEFQEIPTRVPGVRICEHLPKLAALQDQVTLVRSVSHSIGVHAEGARYLMTGNFPSAAVNYPALGSVLAALLPARQGTPAYFTLGEVDAADAGDLGSSFNPFRVDAESPTRIGLPAGFTVTDLERRSAVLERLDARMREVDEGQERVNFDRYQQQALDILRSDRINRALDVTQEPARHFSEYGLSAFGRNALVARRLIEAGARCVTIGFGSWDTHANNFPLLRNTLLPQLDQGLSALLTDLDARGLLAETLVFCTGEFGRTPFVNASAGRDHWAQSMTALLAGGGIRRGFVYGATDADGREPSEGRCTPDDLAATILAQLGFGPEHSLEHRSGRPVALFKQGHVLQEVCQ